MKFRDLVDEFYLHRGFTLGRAVGAIMGDPDRPASGVCESTIESAYHGRRIAGEQAASLVEWAKRAHDVVLSFNELIDGAKSDRGAAERAKRRSELADIRGQLDGIREELRGMRCALGVDWGKRAQDAIHTAIRDAALPDGWNVDVTMRGDGWSVVGYRFDVDDPVQPSAFARGLPEALGLLRMEMTACRETLRRKRNAQIANAVDQGKAQRKAELRAIMRDSSDPAEVEDIIDDMDTEEK